MVSLPICPGRLRAGNGARREGRPEALFMVFLLDSEGREAGGRGDEERDEAEEKKG